MSKIKVLEIIGDPSLAGAPRHLFSLIENINRDKFSLAVIAPPGPLAGEIKSLKKPVECKIIKMNSKFDLSAVYEIRAFINANKPNVIHVHGTRAGFLGRLAAIGSKIPLVYTEHLWTKQYRLSSRIGHRLQITALWFLDFFTSLNIAVSQAVKDFMVENEISRAEKIKVIYNGIEPPAKKAKPFSKKNKLLIGSIGTLNEQKGMQYLIAAMPKILKEFPEAELEIVGDGYYKDNLKNLIKKKRLESKVKLVGFIGDVYSELEKFDLYVQPSVSESFGLAILQAMAAGLPVVATNAGGIPEVVTSGKSGLLVEPKDSKAISQAILDLARDPVEAKKMGQLGEEDAKIKFSLKDMVEETENIYENLAVKDS